MSVTVREKESALYSQPCAGKGTVLFPVKATRNSPASFRMVCFVIFCHWAGCSNCSGVGRYSQEIVNWSLFASLSVTTVTNVSNSVTGAGESWLLLFSGAVGTGGRVLVRMLVDCSTPITRRSVGFSGPQTAILSTEAELGFVSHAEAALGFVSHAEAVFRAPGTVVAGPSLDDERGLAAYPDGTVGAFPFEGCDM